ncbi:unnamed protein product [Heterobilharzia americana]|nr:unnamed protein product [Heterobilharzia americana]
MFQSRKQNKRYQKLKSTFYPRANYPEELFPSLQVVVSNILLNHMVSCKARKMDYCSAYVGISYCDQIRLLFNRMTNNK